MRRPLYGFSAAAILNLLIASCAPTTPDNRTVLKGAGSTFAAPLFKKWSQEYQNVDPTVLVDYDSVGSGAGQSRFVEGTVDFGVSEATLSPEQVSKVDRGVLMVPLAAGGIVLAYSPQGIPDGLRLPRSVYVDIFLGQIKSWNDPRIVAANPAVSLPHRAIEPIVRLDSSGTTYAFTSHLSAISPQWAKGPGIGKLVSWPSEYEKESGNDRLAGMIKQGYGAIGYVEYGTARAAGLHMANLENKRGEFVRPSVESARLALSCVGYEPEQLAALHDPDASGAYPIVTCIWLIVYKHYGSPERADAVNRFVHWSLTNGQKYNDALGYVPLTTHVASNALQSIDETGP